MTASVYRDPREGLRVRRAELLDARRYDLDTLHPDLTDAYVARFARLCAGAVATGGAIALGVNALARGEGSTALLVQELLLVPVVYALAATYARPYLSTSLARALRPSGNVADDVNRLEAWDPAAAVREMADRLEYRSLLLPLVGFAVLAPLALHLVVAQGIGLAMGGGVGRFGSFDGWIATSFAMLGQCYAVVGYKAWRYARALRRTATTSLPLLDDMANGAPWETVGAVAGAALGAGLIYVVSHQVEMYIVAPAVSAFAVFLVGLTAAAVIPALFTWAHRRLLAERKALGL